MKKVAVRNASRAALDWLVAKCEGSDPEIFQYDGRPALRFEYKLYSPSTLWEQGGPIIEREGMVSVRRDWDGEVIWTAEGGRSFGTGPTPLFAIMRCYVSGKLGDEVEVPEELA